MSADLPATLARLEAWLAEHAPAMHAALTPGATDAELAVTERVLGRKLPSALRTLYATHADWGHVLGLTFLSPVMLQMEWDAWRGLEAEFQETAGHSSRPVGAVRAQYINSGWLPFLTDGGGNSVGVDLDPRPTGTLGQVITFGRDVRVKTVLADSLEDFLAEYVARLEAGWVRLHQHEPDEPNTLRLYLLDADGEGSDLYRQLADFYPGFGAAPARRSR